MRVFRENMLVQFSVISFLVIGLVATAIVLRLSGEIAESAKDDLVDEAVGTVSPRLLRFLTPEDLRTPMAGEQYDEMHAFVRNAIESERTARIKLWGRDGTVIYSSDPAGVGGRFPDNQNYLTAWSGDVATEIKIPNDAENANERHLGTLVEVYTPLVFPGQNEPSGVLEIYQYYAPTAARIQTLRWWVIGTVGLGFLILYFGLVGIVWRGWHTIVKQRQQLQSANDRLASQLDTLNQEVEHRIQVQAELEEAKEVAEAANRAKTEFMANVSHELRTPMTAVLGMTSLLLDTKVDAEQKDFIETIYSSGHRLLHLINDILDFSKLEAGRLKLKTAPLRLHACIEEAVNLYAGRAAGKGLALTYRVAPDLPATVLGDADRLRQMLSYLLDNAMKFTDEGEVSVSVDGEEVVGHVGHELNGGGPEGQWRLHFQIQDTGIGISEEARKRLFESFVQGDGSMTRRYGGTGLGLAMCHRICQAMGGTIWMESEEGTGSTVHFTITARSVSEGDHTLAADVGEVVDVPVTG